MSGSFAGHRVFAAFWEFSARHESPRERAMRRFLASEARGRVLEIGVGVGTNWDFLPREIDYVGIEPDPFMRARAIRHASEAGRTVDLVDARAEALPFANEQFDSVLCTLTLCSVGLPSRALSEAYRVLRPGGQLLFFEHVRPTGRVGGALADAATPLWKRLGGGCHPNRRTLGRIKQAGFSLGDVQSFRLGPVPMRAGIAVRP